MTIDAFLREPIRRLSEVYDVHVMADFRSGECPPGLEGIVSVIPMKIERKIAPWRDIVALVRMVRYFRRHQFPLVHSVTPKAGLLAMAAASLAGIKIRIHTFTGQVWATRTGFSRLLLKSADRCISLMTTDILVDSHSQRRFLLQEGVVSEAKSNVLGEGSIAGVDTGRFRPDEKARARIRETFSISDDESLFLYLGRLNRDKGLIELATAFGEIQDDRAHLMVVGPDEEGIAGMMAMLVGDKTERVHFVGYTDKPEEYYAAADVLCLPSCREGFGNVIIEAAAAGIPAVGSRIYGVVDAIVDNETGLLFEVRNAGELRECLSILCGNKALRDRLGRRARERVLASFTAGDLAAAWLSYYRERL